MLKILHLVATNSIGTVNINFDGKWSIVEIFKDKWVAHP